jgi:hypothetical protein
MQCTRTYNVTLRCFRTTIVAFVAVEKQYILHLTRLCVFSLGYPACNARAPYSHLWPLAVQYFSIFFHKRHYVKKKSYST